MTESITVRPMQPGDEPQVFALVQRGFDRFVRPGFTQEGIDRFLAAARALVFDRPPQHFTMIAAAANQIVGMIDVSDNHHISLFFVDARYQRRGIGRQLLEGAIVLCHEREPNLSAIDVYSSLWAVPVYRRLGFQQESPEQERNGVRFVEMVRRVPWSQVHGVDPGS